MSMHTPRRRLLLPVALALFAPAACEEKQPPPRYIDADGAQPGAPATPPPAAPPDAPASAVAPAPYPESDARTANDDVAPDRAAPDADRVTAAGLLWSAPPHWEHRPPASQMRAAEFTAREADAPVGAPTAEVIVSYFGPQGAGAVEENLERWARQVHDNAGRPVVPEIRSFYAGDLLVTLTAATGAFQSGMPGQPATPQPGWTMLAAIIENGPIGPVYVRMIGPAGAVAPLRDSFVELLETLEPAPITPLDHASQPAPPPSH